MVFKEDVYEDQDFTGEAIEHIELARKKFINCNFTDVDFSDLSEVFSCTFETCRFNRAKLNGVNFRNSAFLTCRFKYASLFATRFQGCKMTGSDFVDSDCAMMSIEDGDWSYTNLRKQVFFKQDLTGIRFFGADLSGCHFRQCKMNDCDFREAIVHDTSFFGSDIRKALIENLDVSKINLKNAKIDLLQSVTIAEYLTEAKYVAEREEK